MLAEVVEAAEIGRRAALTVDRGTDRVLAGISLDP